MMGFFKRAKPPISDEMRVLQRLSGKGGNASADDNEKCLFFPEYQLRIQLLECHTKNNGNKFMAYLLFKIDGRDLDEPIIEPSTSLADSREKAIDMAADQFTAVMLSVILSFKCNDMSSIEGDFGGKKCIYHYPCTLPVTCLGNTDGRKIKPLDIVRDELPKYLGARKYTWVKLFEGRTKDKVECEARVNGILVPELSDMLRKHAEEDEDKDIYLMEKQCVLFVQDDSTYVPLRHSPDEVKNIALKAIPMIAEIHDDKSWDDSFDKIFALSGDGWLTIELINFIAEIVAQNRFSFIKHTSDITIKLGEDKTVDMKKQQLTTWCACENAVQEMLSNSKIDDRFLLKVMEFSSSYYSAVCSLLEKHTMEKIAGGDISFCSLQCPFPKEYINYIF